MGNKKKVMMPKKRQDFILPLAVYGFSFAEGGGLATPQTNSLLRLTPFPYARRRGSCKRKAV